MDNSITALIFIERPQYVCNLLQEIFLPHQLFIQRDPTWNIKAITKRTLIITDTTATLPPSLRSSLTNQPLDDGAFIIKSLKINHESCLFILGGDLAGVIYALNEIKDNHISHDPLEIFSQEIQLEDKPTLRHRIFWTWDHSTNWALEYIGKQEFGCFNDYSKTTEAFIQDYQQLIDFMSLNRINGLTIYGLLRDSHGGIDAAKIICEYAQDRGVRLLPGIGINAYGGIYWQGSHQFNLHNWLQQHPHLRAVYDKQAYFKIPDLPRKLSFPHNEFTDAACPSKPENLQYHADAVQWLTETLAIGGINFESGDYALCQCSDCQSKRTSNTTWSLSDMVEIYPKLFDIVHNANPNHWVICETYWDNLLDNNAISALNELPDNAIYQFCCNRSYWQKIQTTLTQQHIRQLPKPINILRTHMGSQWNNERYQLIAQRYGAMLQLLYRTAIQGATIFGEVSAFNTVNEINYLAFSHFSYHAESSWQQFLQQVLAPRFGGVAEAELFLQLLKTPTDIKSINRAIRTAKEASSTLNDATYRRWTWLQNELFKRQSRHYMY